MNIARIIARPVTVSFLIVICFSYAECRWDSLKITWSPLLAPTSLPMTSIDAWVQRWSRRDIQCDGKKGYYGIAYINRDFYPAVQLLYDVNGYIAGIQGGLSLTEGRALGVPSHKQIPPFQEDVLYKRWFVTVYFVDPTIICTTGRTEAEFLEQGTGTNLYIQNGGKTLSIPTIEKLIGPPWVAGQCRITLGKHYWYDISENMKCNELFPIVLLYNGGELNAFGFIIPGYVEEKHYSCRNNSTYHAMALVRSREGVFRCPSLNAVVVARAHAVGPWRALLPTALSDVHVRDLFTRV